MSEKQCHSGKCTMKIVMALIIIMIIAAGFFYFMVSKPTEAVVAEAVKIDGQYLPTATPIEDFKLTDNHGKPFTKKNMMGKWTMFFFGFTNCGYVCPTTMTELTHMYKELQKTLPKNKLPQVVLISVDPERDTVKKMNDYMKAYNANFIGARGDVDATQQLENQLHITAVKVHAEGDPADQYFVNHSAEILLFNPQGELQAYMTYPHKADQMVKDYNLILENSVQ